MPCPVYIGVDVGTGSVRAGAVTQDGVVRAHHTVPITVHNPSPDHYEQDSHEIWTAVCQAVKSVVSRLESEDVVAGLGFDATCSLVVLDGAMSPLTVDAAAGEARWNIVMWMDHRAKAETDSINATKHRVLEYLGGKMSLEMQMPKLLWVKTHLKQTWGKAAHFFDLPDFLTAKATGKLTRSLCSLVCKWTYEHTEEKSGWDSEFLTQIGLADLLDNNCAKIGSEVLAPGSVCGGLCQEAAEQLGLPVGLPVATSLIDAHAGALALMAAGGEGELTGRLAMICGTSSCQLVCSGSPLRVANVWGPYYEALLPRCWLAEAGQSATGVLCDHVRDTHPALDNSLPSSRLPQWLETEVMAAGSRRGLEDPTTLTRHLHVYPDYHGNRAPLADPLMTGMISGLTLDASKDDLVLKYLATIQALAYGSLDIVEQLQRSGHRVSTVLMCGGLAQSQIFTQTHADVLGVEVIVPEQQQLSVVIGAAMLGAAAANGGDVYKALGAMAGPVTRRHPNAGLAAYHEQKYRVYQKMQQDQIEYRALMAPTAQQS